MKLRPQITFKDIEPSEAIEQRILKKTEKLERFYDRIVSMHVTVEAPHRRHHKGRIYAVRIDIRTPGDEIVIGREPTQNHAHEDVYVALRDAFDAAVRKLEDHARQIRGEIKQHEAAPLGTVMKLFPEQGYGFLESTDGLEVYFHEHSVLNHGFARLHPGDRVRFILAEGEGEKGPQASTVQPE